MTRTSRPERRARWLLARLVLIWGASWPIGKIGVTAVPPLWFACLRYVAGTGCVLVIVAVRRELILPSAFTFDEALNVSLALGVVLIGLGVLLTTVGAAPLTRARRTAMPNCVSQAERLEA